MLDLIIKNGTIITADETYKGEIGVENGVITYIGSAGKLDHLINTDPENGPVTKVIDAEGKYVMPGLIEPHMHVKAPFSGTIDMLDFYTASKCAAFGGSFPDAVCADILCSIVCQSVERIRQKNTSKRDLYAGSGAETERRKQKIPANFDDSSYCFWRLCAGGGYMAFHETASGNGTDRKSV